MARQIPQQVARHVGAALQLTKAVQGWYYGVPGFSVFEIGRMIKVYEEAEKQDKEVA